mgnify:CR=1 FL=1
MKFSFLFLFFFVININNAQTIYLDSVTKVSKKTYIYKKNKKKNLKLDYYKPKKLRRNFPLIIYVHGGGFSGGKRNDKNTVNFAKHLTKRGYAVASITYRLTMQKLGFGCNTNAIDKIKAFNFASEDISFAVKYILENKRKFKINSDKIILMGSSAGAEAILNLAYVYNNKILPEEFKFAGLVSMAGAVTSIKNITKKTAIPSQFFHGTKDKLVPYNAAPHHYCKKEDDGFLPLFGSKAIAQKLKELDKSYYLYTIKNGDHSWSGRPLHQCTKEILDFLYYDVLTESKRQTEINVY